MSAVDSQYPYLEGFTNVTETPDSVKCEVEGFVPSWLSGALYRIGPGSFDVEVKPTGKRYEFTHWFDGLGLLHKFQISDGQVEYSSRETAKEMREFLEQGGEPPIMFGQRDPCKSLFSKISTFFTDLRKGLNLENTLVNINVTVTPHFPVKEGDKFVDSAVIKTDGNILRVFDKNTLEMKRFLSYGQFNPEFSGFPSSAHEEWDPETGAYYNHVAFTGAKCGYYVFEVKPSGEMRSEQIIIDTPISYIHSFFSTKKYLILMACPYYIDLQGLSMLWKRNMIDSLNWDSSKPVIFYVIEKSEMKLVAKYQTQKAHFCFHTVNAFDLDDSIVLDFAYYENVNVVENLRVSVLKDVANGQLKDWGLLARIRLDNISDARKSTSIQPTSEIEFITDCYLELARINDQAINGKYFKFNPKYRYVYAPSADPTIKSRFFNSIVKIDISNKTYQRWIPGNGITPGEPIFVQKPDAKEEDDGILLVVCFDGNLHQSILYILDAKEMTVIGQVKAPKIIPYGFHGSFA